MAKTLEKKTIISILQKKIPHSLFYKIKNYKTLREGAIEGNHFLIIRLNLKKIADTKFSLIAYIFDNPAPKLKRRFLNLKFLEKVKFNNSRFSVPLVYYFSKNNDVLIRTDVKGKNLLDHARFQQEFLNQDAKLIAGWLTKLHQISIKGGFHILDVYKDDYEKFNYYLLALKREGFFEKKIEKTAKIILSKEKEFIKKYKNSFIHNDFHPENIFFSKDKIEVIDFDASGKGDPLIDLGYFLAQFNFYTQIKEKILEKKKILSFQKSCLKFYLKNNPQLKEVSQRLKIYQIRSYLRLASFFSEFVLPGQKIQTKSKTVNLIKKLIKLIKI